MRVLIACEYSGAVRDAFLAHGHDAMSCDLLPTDVPGPHYQGDVRDVLDGWKPVQFTAYCDPYGDGWCQVNDCDPDECQCYGPTQDGIEYMEKDGVLFGRPEDRPHWDLMIAHPPCTYLTIAAEWAYKDVQTKRIKTGTLIGAERRAAREEALSFVLELASAPIPRIAIENPVGVLSSRWRKPDQIIQPWQYGHDASKATCLWLKGLPLLRETNRVPGRIVGEDKRGNTVMRWANQTDSGQNRLPPSEDRWKIRSETYAGIAAAMADQWGGQQAALFAT